jgi:dGTPase
MEDAHRLGILSHELVIESFLEVICSLSVPGEDENKTRKNLDKIQDLNEKIGYLRAKAINLLTLKAADVFSENRQQILAGNFNDTLIDNIENSLGAFSRVMQISNERIYNHDTVLEIEIAGYNVMSELLSLFVPALLKQNPNHKDRKILRLIPLQFTEFQNSSSPYAKLLSAFDFISGMTDLYATELYRKLKGVEIPQHK